MEVFGWKEIKDNSSFMVKQFDCGRRIETFSGSYSGDSGPNNQKDLRKTNKTINRNKTTKRLTMQDSYYIYALSDNEII